MAWKLSAIFRRLGLPIGVFAVGTVLSIGLGMAARDEIARSARLRFDAVALQAAKKVEERFDGYTEVLIGLRALFNSNEAVSRAQFRRYVAGLKLGENFPGFQALNYAPYVSAADKSAFEAGLRADASLDKAIAVRLGVTPAGERDGYHPLTLIEPLAGNERAIGRDLGAVAASQKALEQARDTGGLTSSGRKIKIRGRESDIGLAMRLPVYRSDMPHDTVDQRRAAYLGSVGAGFRIADMMRDIVHNGDPAAPRVRIFDTGPSTASGSANQDARPIPMPAGVSDSNELFDSAAEGTAAPAGAQFAQTLGFDLGGHTWVVQVSQSATQVMGSLDRATPWLIALCGMAISALIAGIVYSLITSRARAEGIAHAMTRNLRTSQRRLDEAQHLASLGSWVLDPQTGLLQCSDEAMRIFGFSGTDSLGLDDLLSRVPPAERTNVREQISGANASQQRAEFEHRLVLPDGTQRWVHVIVQIIHEGGKSALRGTVRDDTQRHKAALRLVIEHDVARLLVGDGESNAVISLALEAVCTRLDWDCGALWRVGEDGAVSCGSAWHVDGDSGLEQFVRISRSLSYRKDEGSLGRAWIAGETVKIDTSSTKDHFTRDALAGQAGLTVGLVVPLLSAGRPSALELFARVARDTDEDSIETLRAITLQIAQYEQRKQAEQALRYVANHDALTGLSNRTSLQRDLARAIKRSNRHHKRFAVLFVDLDRFKRINDTLGHGAGDALIKACGERLSGVLREDDAVARFGGDEFVLIVENLSKASDAVVIAEKVLTCCSEPFIVDGEELHVSASIGVSVYPEDGADGETLLKNADTAMYRAKDKGRGTHEFYAAQMNEQGTERLMLENGLRRALARNELELHYQPKMDLRTQRIVGVEALMRWRHPVLGSISPVEFIPIAEESGLIVAMGKWALQTACNDARDWQRRGLPPVQVSVNLSPRQLTNDSIIDDVAEALHRSGLNPELLELEITESAMMKNPDAAAALLQQIRRMGIGLAIDDFGTGYSSLSYLKRFPLTTVKIDRSFVNDLSQDRDAQALTDGIVTLAHGLRMKVVAEGVETAEQLEYLRTHGCDEIQGYWLCKPVPAEDVCQFMARHLRTGFAAPVAA